MRVRAAGERCLLVDLDGMDEVHRLWAALDAAPPDGVEDVVAGARSVLVVLGPGSDLRAAADHIGSRGEQPVADRPAREVSIPVVYDGPDLAGVARLAGLEPHDVVRLHAGATYVVAFLGFSPGFAYMAGLPAELHVPRLDTPRTSVPAGSVAVAAGMTAVYPRPTPGGWRLIGRSGTAMFEPDRPGPSSAPATGSGSSRWTASRAPPQGARHPPPRPRDPPTWRCSTPGP